ncbi:MAG: hypothetical protein M1831_003758 [Alyxoria varia]|nr:MAG: hypothetical protein M1831_003758 [Alyxoria varia]
MASDKSQLASPLANLPPSVLAQYPAMPPPPGVIPDLTSPNHRGPELVVCGTVFLAVALLAFTCRVYAKVRIVHKYSWDDLTCLLGLIATIGFYTGFVWGGVKGPFGKHQWNVPVTDIMDHSWTIPSFIATPFGNLAFCLIKLSFLLFYYNMFWPMRWLRISVYISAALNVAFYTATFIPLFVFSVPKAGRTWFEQLISPEFFKNQRLAIPITAVGFGIDLFLFALPIRAVSKLQLPLRRKIGVITIFAMGLLVIEMSIGITCVCMPLIARMFSHHGFSTQKLRSWLTHSLKSSSHDDASSWQKMDPGRDSSNHDSERDLELHQPAATYVRPDDVKAPVYSNL